MAADFLGPEFLLWFWQRSEALDGAFDDPDGGILHAWIDDHLILESPFGDARESRLTKGDPAVSPEAAVALWEGKKVREARIRIEFGTEHAALFTIRAQTLQISGLRVPAILHEDPLEIFLERVHWLERIERFVQYAYGAFCHERLDAALWAERKRRIEQWIADKHRRAAGTSARLADSARQGPQSEE